MGAEERKHFCQVYAADRFGSDIENVDACTFVTYLAIVRSLQGSQEVLSKNKLEPLPDCFPHMEWFRGVWFTAQPQESISPFLSPQLDLKL